MTVNKSNFRKCEDFRRLADTVSNLAKFVKSPKRWDFILTQCYERDIPLFPMHLIAEQRWVSSHRASEQLISKINRVKDDSHRKHLTDELLEDMIRCAQNGPEMKEFKGTDHVHAWTNYFVTV